MNSLEIDKRLFIAIMPDKKTRDYLRDAIRVLTKYSRNLRFVNVEQLHMTLQFLGNNVTDESLEQIISRLKSIDTNGITIQMAALHFGFKGQTHPSVLFWEVEDNDKLKQLTKEVHTYVQELKLEDIKKQKDHSKLIHHITLARTKRTFSHNEVKKLMEKFNKDFTQEPPAFSPAEFVIMQSVFNKNGNVYKIIETFPL